MSKEISLIIVNFNGRNILGECLRSVYDQVYKNFEVMLVDNGSSDGSVPFTKDHFPEVRVICLEKNYGFATANNIGIKEASKNGYLQYYALLNNDMKLHPRWLKNLAEAAKHDKSAGGFQSKILSMSEPGVIDALGIALTRSGRPIQIGSGEVDVERHENLVEVFGACAGAVLYKREMLEDIGLFDEDFFAYYEDVDLALRARMAGWRCLCVPTAIVYHRQSYTLGKFSPRKAYFLERNVYFYMIKNMPKDVLFRFSIGQALVIVRIIMGVFKRAIFLDRGGIRFNLHRLKGNLDGILSIAKMVKKRRKNFSERPKGIRELAAWIEH